MNRATVLVLLELGAAAFFASGAAARALGPVAPWFVLAAVVIGIGVRLVDLEGCSLFIPGGLYGKVKDAFGKTPARLAASALLVEHVMFGALAAVVAGQYLTALTRTVGGSLPLEQLIAADLATAVAVGVIGGVWWWQRQGRVVSSQWSARAMTFTVGVLSAVVAIGLRRLWHVGLGASIPAAAALPAFDRLARLAPHGIAAPLAAVTALGYCLFAVGGAEALERVTADVPQPRIQHLRRIAVVASGYGLVFIAGTVFIDAGLSRVGAPYKGLDAPLAVAVGRLGLPGWLAAMLFLVVAAAAALLLTGSASEAGFGGQQVLIRLSEEGVVAASFRAPHPRFGTPARAVDLVAAVQLAVVLLSAGRVDWLARAYAVGIIWTALLKVAALVRFRRIRPEPRAFRVGLNLRLFGREWPVGLVIVGGALGLPALLMWVAGDSASIAGTGCVLGVLGVLTASERLEAKVRRSAPAASAAAGSLLAPRIGIEAMPSRPGSVLVAVRRPHFLAHLTAAFQAAGRRPVIVMTVRVFGLDADAPSSADGMTEDERRVLTAAVTLAERYGRAVSLLIVPSASVFDAVAETAAHLQCAEVYVGESETLSADDQARLLGEAWERAPKAQPLDVRLVIYHSSGRTASYHLGAHAPTLTPADLDLIHVLWLDAAKTVGPHLHHHDVVRAALKFMEQQLNENGPPRDAALELVREVARPADELAAVVHERDFARLRDMVRNRPANDLARLLTDLTIEDQVVAFRVLPRKLAASTFEYLDQDAQETLLKAMAQEDVAGLLNNMAPDDRTMFLEELPASVTQQLLALLTPGERTVAVTLLGYPENSIGRLMTPDYIAIREHWTVQEVLDFVRAHGHDSETLNVLYVVDDHGVLIDDVRIREFLLTSVASRVSDLMDRRFVALKAADDQNTAVARFRSEDRSALPVTDSAGVLIGIVTIDDVLDVAEAEATKEIQRFGGSEALEEPYMQVGFGHMIRKRAGWLTALFLGEMLTATAMGIYQDTIQHAVQLALFLPLIISSGGNSGSQASTLVIRALALGEVRLKDWWRIMRREFAAGIALGAILGVVGILRITVWSTVFGAYGVHWAVLALTVGTALVGVVLWGSLIGSLLPLLLRRLGFDPATSSAPLVATLVNVTGLVIYFSVALVMLRGTLL